MIGEEKYSYRLKLHDEQLRDYKKELSDVNLKLLSPDLSSSDEPMTLHSRLGEALFASFLRIKELTRPLTPSTPSRSDPTPASGDPKGVKLPKLDVPVFNGNILNWRNFWEQFSVSVHDRPSLSDSEKLVYLQQALKGGSAKGTIGLSRSSDNYKEAIACLQA